MIIVYRCLLLAATGLAFVDAIDLGDGNCTDVRINNGPLITPCVSEIILEKGQNFTLTCKGSTKLRFRQQDVSEEVTSNFTIVNTSSPISEEGFSFQRTLTLYHVDQYAIGYYACSDDFVSENIDNTITEDPENTEHVSYIYVYVHGTDSLFAPMRELVMSRSNKILIECRPTTPDVGITLLPPKSQNKTPKYSPKIGFVLKQCDSFAYTCQGQRGNIKEKKRIRISVTEPPVPQIAAVPNRFLPGDNITLNCTVNMTRNNIVVLAWTFYKGLSMEKIFSNISNADNVTEGVVYNTLKLYNASIDNAGNYTCVSAYGCQQKESNRVEKIYIEKEFLKMRIKNRGGLTKQKYLSLAVELDGHPAPNITILKNGEKLLFTDTLKYNLTYKQTNYDFGLKIMSLNIADSADYTFIASNGVLDRNATYQLRVAAEPVINNFGVIDKTCEKGTSASFKCEVSGGPIPDIGWIFSNNGSQYPMNSNNQKETSLYNKTSILDVQCLKTGIITCSASNTMRSNVTASRRLLVFEMMNGFGISTQSDNGQKWVKENDLVSLKCLASLYVYSNVTWEINDDEIPRKTVKYPDPTEFSHVAELIINNITLNDVGGYKCVGVKNDENVTSESIQINVLKLQPATIVDHSDNLLDENVHNVYKKIVKSCIVTGVPLPKVQWFKDDQLLPINESNVFIYEKTLNRTTINSTMEIHGMQPENVGKYTCVGKSTTSLQRKAFTLVLKVDHETNKMVTHYLIAIAVIVLILIILIVYLTLKIKKEKRFRKELAAAGLLYFKEGVINSLNPDLGIDEQAELLPYDEKFEFPPEKLVFGKQLGAGAFGVVYKAEARGIINAEETTTVAVKMVKKTADNMYIKALASELKIMVHLGKHINIVNLLGACTKNVGKRELVVIVEYCLYGNIHNYMQRHREVFIDQLDTDNKEKLGKVNRAYTSTSCGSTGMHSEYFGSTNTQDTDNTFLNTANTVQSARKTSEGYVHPEWRSNYESDYSYNGRSPRPLTSRDLLAWAFQIARGMEYLASRKVLHGDLAARNILLAEDNIVKICDFGLAKSIYKNDEYQSKPNCLLPVKWLAIECITDRIFSTQSDVWSFGIVLWELFSLAKTPYPNLNPASLLPFLSEGHRLDKPAYADDRLYTVMNNCWNAKPTLRPSFSQLQALLGTFLEDAVRDHYVDLNSSYMDKNAKAEGQEDYLDMMCAPDYNNMVTPSPHHYVNDKNFFPPTPVRVDDGGYLQMSPTNQGPFSPRLPSEFDFDPRKFNPKTSEASSCGSELTPMLTLNNLPTKSGSESDHEGNALYQTVCSRIDEEADEVFAPSLETKNAKNMLQSVTNPTYITFDNIDKKPKDIINNYVNINVPNGLVK